MHTAFSFLNLSMSLPEFQFQFQQSEHGQRKIKQQTFYNEKMTFLNNTLENIVRMPVNNTNNLHGC